LGIDGNEKADKLSRLGSSHPLTGPELALGLSAKFGREVIRGWMSRKHEYWHFIHGQRLRACFKDTLFKWLGSYST